MASYSKEELVELLASWIKKNERIPQARQLTKQNVLPAYNTLKKHFKSVKLALTEAKKRANMEELSIRSRSDPYSREEIIDHFKKWIENYSRFPKMV